MISTLFVRPSADSGKLDKQGKWWAIFILPMKIDQVLPRALQTTRLLRAHFRPTVAPVAPPTTIRLLDESGATRAAN